MAKKKVEEEVEIKPGGGRPGERDPLTMGVTTHGEDIKGASTRVEADVTEPEAAALSETEPEDGPEPDPTVPATEPTE